MIHQGSIIEKAIRNSGISIAEVSRRLNVNRKTIYNWFDQPRLSIDNVKQVGEAIMYDFSKDFPDFSFKSLPNSPTAKSDAAAREVMDEINYWKMKYAELLEKYNFQLEKSSKFKEVA
jgi:hypothetical protein